MFRYRSCPKILSGVWDKMQALNVERATGGRNVARYKKDIWM